MYGCFLYESVLTWCNIGPLAKYVRIMMFQCRT